MISSKDSCNLVFSLLLQFLSCATKFRDFLLMHFKVRIFFLAFKVQVNKKQKPNPRNHKRLGVLGKKLKNSNSRISKGKKSFLKPDPISNALLLSYCFSSFQIYYSHSNHYVTSTLTAADFLGSLGYTGSTYILHQY